MKICTSALVPVPQVCPQLQSSVWLLTCASDGFLRKHFRFVGGQTNEEGWWCCGNAPKWGVKDGDIYTASIRLHTRHGCFDKCAELKRKISGGTLLLFNNNLNLRSWNWCNWMVQCFLSSIVCVWNLLWLVHLISIISNWNLWVKTLSPFVWSVFLRFAVFAFFCWLIHVGWFNLLKSYIPKFSHHAFITVNPDYSADILQTGRLLNNQITIQITNYSK